MFPTTAKAIFDWRANEDEALTFQWAAPTPRDPKQTKSGPESLDPARDFRIFREAIERNPK